MTAFSLAHVLRQVSLNIWRVFFAKMNIETSDIPWERLQPDETDVLNAFLFQLPQETLFEVEGTLREVHSMASFLGMEAFQNAAKTLQISDWNGPFTKRIPLINKALWVWMQHHELFELAKSRHQLEQTPWWEKRIGLPKMVPAWDLLVKDTLENELQNFFLQTQGRGHHCTVEMQHFGDEMYYFVAHTDDYVQNLLAHNGQGKLVTKKNRPTFDLLYAYNKEEGSLEICVPGCSQVKNELVDIFTETVFDEFIEPPKDDSYNLSLFKNPHFSFALDPLDNIGVLVKELQFQWETKKQVRYIAKNEPDFLTWVKRMLNENDFSLESADVTFAKLQFVFYATANRRRGSLTFEVSPPNRSTLPGKKSKYASIIYRYLYEWGILNGTET